MKKLFAYGGVAASVVLIAFGIGSIVVGVVGRGDVRDTLAREQIVGTDDMSPAAIRAGAKEAGLKESQIDVPSRNLVGKEIDTGDEARAFAGYMRIHTLEATGGLTYAEMGRFQAKPNAPASETDGRGGTNNPKYAVIDAKTKQPVSNPARDIWVTETALATALNTSFFAERVSIFSIVMGIALLLTGIGFLVLTLGGALGLVPIPRRAARTSPVPTT